MANERLYQFPSKPSPVPADIVYVGDSASSFNEVNCTIAQIISAYPNLSGIAGLTLGANTFPYSNNSAVLTAGSISALAVSLLADTTIATMQATLGYTATPTATLFAGWDANKNLSANSLISGYTTTATAGATTTLTVGSTQSQFFTGSSTQTVLLPVTSTLVLGQPFYIVNNSSGSVTVQSSGANNIQVMAANTTLYLTCILTSGTTAASWYADYNFQTALILPISLANGGTNNSLTANAGGIVWSDASKLNILAGTSTANQILLSGNAATPAWSTSTYPATNAANTLLYASSANTMSALATANNSGLLTNGSGVPAWVTVTGTGAPVLATSPSLITPTLGVATATSLNFGASATNGLIGVTSGSSAAAGVVGEIISSTITAASTTSISSGATTNLTSITLSAGDWDIYANIGINGTTVGTTVAGISNGSASLPNQEYRFYSTPLATSVTVASPVPSFSVSISTPTIYYLVINSSGTGSMIMYGNIVARRRR